MSVVEDNVLLELNLTIVETGTEVSVCIKGSGTYQRITKIRVCYEYIMKILLVESRVCHRIRNLEFLSKFSVVPCSCWKTGVQYCKEILIYNFHMNN